MVVCVPAYVRDQSCCIENTVTTRGVKETRLVPGIEESSWKYYTCDDVGSPWGVASYEQEASYELEVSSYELEV